MSSHFKVVNREKQQKLAYLDWNKHTNPMISSEERMVNQIT